ncbi:MAG: hypothetical protein NC489_37785 [Ruminococcus flavefaciens]|nr:hypothetical protein [Ruminococcus flavefaciens]
MGRKKAWITKSEITKILKTYSIRPDEFQPIDRSPYSYSYQSQYAKGYVISIRAEELKAEHYHEETGRILVSHTQQDGRKTFMDVWEHDKNNKLEFKFRNLWNQPLSDADYVKQIEQDNAELNKAGLELQQALKEFKSQSHKNIETDMEKQTLLEQIQALKQENQQLKEKIGNAKKAGRPLSQERMGAVRRMQELMSQGCSDKEIMETLDISRATYFRYKKSIKNISDTE